MKPRIGPDATGAGWADTCALMDRTGQHDLAQFTSPQSRFLEFELIGGVGSEAMPSS